MQANSDTTRLQKRCSLLHLHTQYLAVRRSCGTGAGTIRARGDCIVPHLFKKRLPENFPTFFKYKTSN